MTHPLRVAENCPTHPLHKAQNLMTHPLSAPAGAHLFFLTSPLRRYFGIDIVFRRLSVAMDCKDWKWIETYVNKKIQDIQQPVKYGTDSDNESDEEGDFIWRSL